MYLDQVALLACLGNSQSHPSEVTASQLANCCSKLKRDLLIDLMTSKDMVSLRKGLVKCRRNTQGVHEHSSAAVVLLHLLLRVDTDTCILRKDTWLQAVSVHSALDTDSSSIRGVMSMDNGCEKQQLGQRCRMCSAIRLKLDNCSLTSRPPTETLARAHQV